MNSINAVGTYPLDIDAQYEAVRQKAMSDISSDETADAAGKASSFKDVITEFLAPANELDFQDKVSNAELMIGDADNLHSTMIAGEYADLAVKLTAAVRNKVIDAYNEVMRMQI